MKPIRNVFIFIALGAVLFSCSNDDEDSPTINPLEGFNLLTTINANDHALEIYSETQEELTIGYNKVYLRIKDAEGSYFTNPTASWMPMMHMMNRNHSCPKSALEIAEDSSVLQGYVVFQMPSNPDEYWDIAFTYQVDGTEYAATGVVEVNPPSDEMRKISVFTGSDDTKYVLAMMPFEPEVSINDFSAMLFTMQDMMTFPVVENYTVGIDPRMPGMDNHSSPNNEDLVYDSTSKMYKGKLSLTMTGYWKINLKLMDESDLVLKGEDVTEQNEASSLYFEIEF